MTQIVELGEDECLCFAYTYECNGSDMLIEYWVSVGIVLRNITGRFVMREYQRLHQETSQIYYLQGGSDEHMLDKESAK